MTGIEFLCSLPPIQSAIKIGQDGMRVQLDIPESEMGRAVHLLTMRGQILKITVELESAALPDKQATNTRRKWQHDGEN